MPHPRHLPSSPASLSVALQRAKLFKASRGMHDADLSAARPAFWASIVVHATGGFEQLGALQGNTQRRR